MHNYFVELNEFLDILYKQNFIIIFNHPVWQSQALKYIKDPELLKSANLLTLQKLLTLQIRKERFHNPPVLHSSCFDGQSGGHLASHAKARCLHDHCRGYD